VFHPRSAATAPTAGPIVWTIDQAKLPNYLLPRDCPRVTFGAGPATTPSDRERFSVRDGRVIVIEGDWLRRICDARLHVYEFDPAGFRLLDEIAGYWVTSEPAVPMRVSAVTDPPTAIVKHGGELRVVDSLWPVHDAVAQSTLAFSMIRMRNARNRES